MPESFSSVSTVFLPVW